MKPKFQVGDYVLYNNPNNNHNGRIYRINTITITITTTGTKIDYFLDGNGWFNESHLKKVTVIIE